MPIYSFFLAAAVATGLFGYVPAAKAEPAPDYMDMRRDIRRVDRVFEEGFRAQEDQADLPPPEQHPLMLAFGSNAKKPMVAKTRPPYRFGIQGGITRGTPQAQGFDFGVFLTSPSSRLGLSFVEEKWIADDEVTRAGQSDVLERGISQRGVRGEWESRIGLGADDRFSDAWTAESARDVFSAMQLRYHVQAEASQAQYFRSSAAAIESGLHAAGRLGVGIYVPGLLQVRGGVTTGIPGDTAIAIRPNFGAELFFWGERIGVVGEVLGTRKTLRLGSRISIP